jgi:hypothetical protein
MSFDAIEYERSRYDKSDRWASPAALPADILGNASERYPFGFLANSSNQAGSRLTMYYESYKVGEVSEGFSDIRASRESSSEGKDLLVSHRAAAASRLSGAAQRVMDGLLREFLRRKSLTP